MFKFSWEENESNGDHDKNEKKAAFRETYSIEALLQWNEDEALKEMFLGMI
jgi:hypothetical protein